MMIMLYYCLMWLFLIHVMDVIQVGVNVATTRKKNPLSLSPSGGPTSPSGVQFYFGRVLNFHKSPSILFSTTNNLFCHAGTAYTICSSRFTRLPPYIASISSAFALDPSPLPSSASFSRQYAFYMIL
jgi:hypothetical protein